MPLIRPGCAECTCSDDFGANIPASTDGGSMAKEERKRLVLKLLYDSRLALSRKVIFRNLKVQGATFEERTTVNYLNELVDDGLVQRVSAFKMADGDLVDAGDDEPGYYLITQAGVEVFEDNS